MWALVDADEDLVDGPYIDEESADEALTDYERGGRNTHDDVHTVELDGTAAWNLIEGAVA